MKQQNKLTVTVKIPHRMIDTFLDRWIDIKGHLEHPSMNLPSLSTVYISPMVIIGIRDVDISTCTRSNLNSLCTQVEEIFTAALEEPIEIFSRSLHIFGQLPKHPIDVPDVLLAPSEPISIAGIEKIFMNVDKLVIDGTFAITDGVLSLLLLNGKVEFSMGLKASWVKIILNHLESRDVLACQEELIEAGLEDLG